MKMRSALLVLCVLLLPATVATAATAPGPAPAAPALTLLDGPACDAGVGGASGASFAALLPAAPVRLSGALCGSCSKSPCAGATVGELCGFSGGQYGYCQPPLGDTCSTGWLKCQCWYGPLP